MNLLNNGQACIGNLSVIMHLQLVISGLKCWGILIKLFFASREGQEAELWEAKGFMKFQIFLCFLLVLVYRI